MTFFKSYIKQRRKQVFTFFLFSLIFFSSFALYHLPLKAILYPVLLSALAGSLLLISDYRKARERYRQLTALSQLSYDVIGPLPPASGPAEEAYQQIIRHLCQEQCRYHTAMDRRYQDMIEYYTVWAHQIKTPLASMGLHLQNQDTPLSHQLSLDLLRVEQYVEMVMMFLRLDSQDTDYVIREQDIDSVLRGAIKKFAGEFIARRLQLNYEPVHTTAVTDEKWLSFVIEQILSNALKYTPSGCISITLEAPKTLCIQDTGIGISPEDLPRIFERGYTGYNGRQDKRASGIGLYLCRRICTRLGHPISIRSTLGEGTCVRLDLAQEQRMIE